MQTSDRAAPDFVDKRQRDECRREGPNIQISVFWDFSMSSERLLVETSAPADGERRLLRRLIALERRPAVDVVVDVVVDGVFLFFFFLFYLNL